MKRKLITVGLITGLCIVPCKRSKADPQPALMGLVCAVLVISIGGYCLYELVQVCKRNLNDKKDDPNNPPGTNNNYHVESVLPPSRGNLSLNDDGVSYADCSASGLADPVSGSLVTTHMLAKLESSTDLVNWSEYYSMEGWASATGMQCLYTSNGIPVLTNYVTWGSTNFIPLSVASGHEPQRFFRLSAGH